VRVVFQPPTEGGFEDTLRLEFEGGSLTIALEGVAVSCRSSACVTASFDEESGTCVETPLLDGTFCKTPCLIGGRCEAGTCQGYAVDCDDGNPCTSDSCDEDLGCVYEDSTSSCPGADEPCRVAFCDPATGCGVLPAADGVPCETHCTIGQCHGGSCVGEPRNCDDGNACTQDICEAATGCVHQDVTSTCPVPSPCQAPVCNPLSGCGTVPIADGTPCGPATCDGLSLCSAGQCQTVPLPETGSCGCNDERPQVSLAVGANHTCRITPSRTVECWGLNSHGQLGNGTFEESNVPVQVTGLTDVVQISGSWYHTCARTAGGRVYCWGANHEGNVNPGGSWNPGVNLPYLIPELSDVVSVSAGEFATCAVKSDGTVWCWGLDFSGQWGFREPMAQIPSIVDAVSVSTHWYSGCALLSDSTVRCWGGNQYSHLGVGTLDQWVYLPRPAVTRDGLLHGVVELSLGVPPCVRMLTGDVLCGPRPSSYRVGAEATFPDADGPFFSPVDFDGCATQLSSGDLNGCARLEDGTARCWGIHNDAGQMGTGDYLPPPDGLSDVSGISGVAEIHTSSDHSCASFEDGGFRCWGENTCGQLGDGTNVSRPAP
jgi:Regulator of chromosome condensation (RCC1) repeat